MIIAHMFPDKLEELVLHIANMSENDPQFHSTKLNKLVWAADFQSFCETGRTITGAPYQKEKYGPVPRAMPIILNRLQKTNRIKLKPQAVGTKQAKRPIALARANLTAFSQRDLAFVDKAIAESFGKTGTAMSRETHLAPAWQAAELGTTIPFAAWLVSRRQPLGPGAAVLNALEKRAAAWHAQN